MPSRILLCGNDVSLLNTRGMLLAHAGYSVVSACSRGEIVSFPADPPIELAIIGHSFAEEHQFLVAEDVRDRWPATKILFLASSREPLRQISQREYIGSSVSPNELIAACREILRGYP